MRIWLCSLFLLAACASTPYSTPAVSRIAEDYVRLALEIDKLDEGYVDAYIGPPETREAIKAAPTRTPGELRAEAERLLAPLRDTHPRDGLEAARVRFLIASLESMRFRLGMIAGERRTFVEEAEALFALTPALHPLERYDPILARLEAMVPGQGPLNERIDAVRARYAIPLERLQAVMEAAIAECRRRTAAHIALPDDEAFTMEFVAGQSWSAYNWYQGQNRSLIQVNTDQAVTPDRALGLGCHEGYPGHHVQGLKAERNYREGGWAEQSVLLLYNPASPLWEGGGNYGVELAFPGAERLAFERDVLFPLAGLDPTTAQSFHDLRAVLGELASARLTIAQRYLDGEIDREQAIALTQRYQLVSRARAEQSTRFTEHYRAYVINYVSGEEIVRAYVERAGPDAAARWAAYEHIISTPVLPRELMP